ncbi:hypothetical protein MUN82_10655 [Hymenobacter aerilatus]|uniref:Uncharacterized protein n=1 Tax=Hymenobacter aerilatus TaxID=2932251 RepID=A0A8T9T079_9BACT|nr:hypothetical protein [Hymenobacter aerilatus]UOR07535.1 hypothetical protein MUN82_10655 [Hymenobacter aerilatus]
MSASTTQVVSPPARPTWRWWYWAVLGVGALLGVAFLALDPWLRQYLEKQVAQSTHGRYQLHIAELHTSLWDQSLYVRGVQLRTVGPSITDTAALPPLQLRLGHARLTGVGLWQLLQRGTVPVDSLVLDSLHLRLQGKLPTARQSQPLHQRLPMRLQGLRLGYLALRHVRATYQPDSATAVGWKQATFSAQDILLSAAGAADSQRVGYAAAMQGQLFHLKAAAAQHRLALRRVWFASRPGTLVVDSVVVRPQQPLSEVRSRNARVALQLPRLLLSGLHTADLARHRFRADTLLLLACDLDMTAPRVPPPPIHRLLAPWFDRVQLEHLLLANASARIRGLEEQPRSQRIAVQGSQLRIDSVGAQDQQRVLYARQWDVRTGVVMARLDPPFYELACQSAHLATRGGLLEVNNLRLRPLVSVAELSRRKHHQAPHVTLLIPQLRATAVQYAALTNQHRLAMQTLTIRQPRVQTRSDGRFALNPAHSVATPEALRHLGFTLDIRRINVQNGTLYTIYRAPQNPKPGELTINRVSGTIDNFSNDPHRMSAAHPAVVHATAWLQNRCRLQATLRANLLDPNGRHSITGTFSEGQLSMLNPMTVPTKQLVFRSGLVHNIRFQLQADRQRVTGPMWANYSNLKLTILSQQGGADHKTLGSRLKTTLVNGLFLRDDNPRKGKLQVGNMTSARDLRVSVFTLWRQGIVSGMFNSAGVPALLSKKLSEQQDKPVYK